VAKVELSGSDAGLVQYDCSSVASLKSSGKKCIRCWNFYESLGSDPEHPEICARCTNVVKSL